MIAPTLCFFRDFVSDKTKTIISNPLFTEILNPIY